MDKLGQVHAQAILTFGKVLTVGTRPDMEVGPRPFSPYSFVQTELSRLIK
jgi:hypothetical protein